MQVDADGQRVCHLRCHDLGLADGCGPMWRCLKRNCKLKLYGLVGAYAPTPLWLSSSMLRVMLVGSWVSFIAI